MIETDYADRLARGLACGRKEDALMIVCRFRRFRKREEKVLVVMLGESNCGSSTKIAV